MKEELLPFYEFIYDRHLIWYRKNVIKMKAPWTTDNILMLNRFCNVYRELDKGTIYIIDYLKTKNLDFKEAFFAIVAYRIFNLVGTFETHFDSNFSLESFDFKSLEKKFDTWRSEGKRIYNTAYLINPLHDTTHRPDCKHTQSLMLLNYVKTNIDKFETTAKNASNIQEILDMVGSIKSFGDFMVGQIVTDLCYLNHIPYSPSDFVTIGPGSGLGIDILSNTPIKPKDKTDCCKILYHNQQCYFELLFDRKGKSWRSIHYKEALWDTPYLTLMDIQNCLCEYGKYYKLKRGKGRKRYYNGES